MQLNALVAVSTAVAATSSRTAKTEAIAELLRGAAPEEVRAAVAFLAGDLLQRRIGVGWAQLRELPPPRRSRRLTVAEVDRAFERDRRAGRRRLAGRAPRGARRALFAARRPSPSSGSSSAC